MWVQLGRPSRFGSLTPFIHPQLLAQTASLAFLNGSSSGGRTTCVLSRAVRQCLGPCRLSTASSCESEILFLSFGSFSHWLKEKANLLLLRSHDCILDGIVQKVFPRPALEEAQAGRRRRRGADDIDAQAAPAVNDSKARTSRRRRNDEA